MSSNKSNQLIRVIYSSANRDGKPKLKVIHIEGDYKMLVNAISNKDEIFIDFGDRAVNKYAIKECIPVDSKDDDDDNDYNDPYKNLPRF